MQKAQQDRAIINRQRKRDTTIKEYPFGFLIVYFTRSPETQPADILQVIREGQRRERNKYDEIIAYYKARYS